MAVEASTCSVLMYHVWSCRRPVCQQHGNVLPSRRCVAGDEQSQEQQWLGAQTPRYAATRRARRAPSRPHRCGASRPRAICAPTASLLLKRHVACMGPALLYSGRRGAAREARSERRRTRENVVGEMGNPFAGTLVTCIVYGEYVALYVERVWLEAA